MGIRKDAELGTARLRIELPKCKECGGQLEPYGDYMWICRAQGCIRSNIAFKPKLSKDVEVLLEAHRMIREVLDDGRSSGSS